MPQEEKDLLLKDLSARLPYHPIIYGKIGYTENEGHLTGVYTSGCTIMTSGGSLCHYSLDELKPYLRPMSSMTKEEYEEETTLFRWNTGWEHYDWLNAHHFDFRGLIPMGLALEALEGMYKKK